MSILYIVFCALVLCACLLMILNFLAWHRRYCLRERRNRSEAPDTTDSSTDLIGIDVSDVLSPRIAYCFVFLCIKNVNAESVL